MIQIHNHRIVSDSVAGEYRFQASNNHSGTFNKQLPDTIVLHYTAGASYTSSANWLCDKQAKASAHIVVGRQGELVQLIPFNTKAWHAGLSQWQGRTGLNSYSIGIEMANAGRLERRADGYYTSYGTKVDDREVVLAQHKHGTKPEAWEAYTANQINSVKTLCAALIKAYAITQIVGHDDIAPARKLDPGPAFPLHAMRNALLFSRADDEVPDNYNTTKGIVNANLLNIRSAPDANASTVSAPLKRGVAFTKLQTKGEWVKIKVETQGWVNARYITIIDA